MHVPRPRSGDQKHHVPDKYWLLPRPEMQEKIDVLRSREEVFSCARPSYSSAPTPMCLSLCTTSHSFLDFKGDRSKCKNGARETYEALLALTDGDPGIVRQVTVSNMRGDNPGMYKFALDLIKNSPCFPPPSSCWTRCCCDSHDRCDCSSCCRCGA